MTDQSDQLGAALTDRYTIERELGEGGMAVVYLARDVQLGRRVAIKVLRPELAVTMGADRFVREVEVTAQLQHPNILPVFESGEADGLLYYVMPFIDGESLADRLARETQLPLPDVIQITGEVAGALSHSHARGIVHRDIKPENILLSGGHAIVADFGIARAATVAGGEKLTQTGMAIGTPAYMSPEQSAGSKNVDHRTDIYALGCVAYEMLVGETPYTGPTAQAIIAKRFTDPIPSVRRLRNAVPEHVDAAIEKALDKTAADRFDTAEAFVQALTGERPVVSLRSSTADTVVMAGGRGPRWRAWAAVSVVAVAAAGFGLRFSGRSGAPDPVSIVMAGTTVAGTDTSLAPVVDMALESAMLESPHVMMMGRRQIQLAFEGLGREHDPTLDQATALEIARRTGAAAVVQPSVLGVGDGFMLNVRMLDASGEPIAVSQASTERAAGLMVALDSLQLDVRRKLGERQGDLDDSRSLLYVTTPSPEALSLYVEAERAEGDLPRIALLEQALALDSSFALALMTLAARRQNAGLDFLEPTERLLATVDKLPTVLRLFVEADAAQSVERDFGKSVERAMLTLDVIPSSGVAEPTVWGGAYNTLILALMELGEFARAATVFEQWADSIRSGRADESLGVFWGNRALLSAQMGDSAATARWLAEDEETGRPVAVSGLGKGVTAAAGGRWRAAAGEYARSLAPGADLAIQFLGSLGLGTAEAVRGRPQSSRAVFRRTLATVQAIGIPNLVASVRLQWADAELFVLASPERAAELVTPLLEDTLAAVGIMRRYRARARAIAAAICAGVHAPSANPSEPPLECGRATAAENPNDAVENLERRGWQAVAAGEWDNASAIGGDRRLAAAGGLGLRARLPAAHAWEQLGHADSAVAFYRRLTATPFGLTSNAPSAFVMRSYGLQRLAAMDGEPGRAARERLREWWADAEDAFERRVVTPHLGLGR